MKPKHKAHRKVLLCELCSKRGGTLRLLDGHHVHVYCVEERVKGFYRDKGIRADIKKMTETAREFQVAAAKRDADLRAAQKEK
jgi:hypothetical protein